MKLNKDYNHVEDGVITRYKAGEDAKELPKETQKWLIEQGHIEGVDAKKDEDKSKAGK